MISISLLFYYEKVFTHMICKDDWKKLNEIPLPEKEDFYSHLKMEDITDAGCTYAKRVCKKLLKQKN